MCVAQLDRALGYGPRCRGFESSHAREKNKSFGSDFFVIASVHFLVFYSASDFGISNHAQYHHETKSAAI